MVSERDIYNSAYQLINQHGKGAMDYAANRMKALAKEYDLDGVVVWLDILHAINELQTPTEKRNLN